MGDLDWVECVCEIQGAIDWVESLYWGLGRYVSKDLLGYNSSLPFPIPMTVSLPFRNGKKAILRAETVAKRNGPLFAKQTLNLSGSEWGSEG